MRSLHRDDFPAELWKHLRTTNVIESSFATVRHRTVRSKGCLPNKTALPMIFKLADRTNLASSRRSQLVAESHPQGKVQMTDWRSSDRKFKPLPPDPLRHQDSAIAPVNRCNAAVR
jgi:transposase-like protein